MEFLKSTKQTHFQVQKACQYGFRFHCGINYLLSSFCAVLKKNTHNYPKGLLKYSSFSKYLSEAIFSLYISTKRTYQNQLMHNQA